MEKTLDFIEIETNLHPQQSIIWMHGLGADGHDFEPIAKELKLNIPTRFIFPHASFRSVTVNGGYEMRAWYDILGQDFERDQDEKGILESVSQVEDFIEMEIKRGVKEENIVMAGFSQGGVIALIAGLSHKYNLGGVIALSTYLPKIHDKMKLNKLEKLIFMGHGRQDAVVPFELGLKSKDILEELKYKVDWKEYNMGHSVCPEEIIDIQNWINSLRERK